MASRERALGPSSHPPQDDQETTVTQQNEQIERAMIRGRRESIRKHKIR